MHSPTFAEWVEIAVAVASIAVAGATLLLARRTTALGEETKRMAEATEIEARAVTEQAQISSAALETSIKPWLTRSADPHHRDVYVRDLTRGRSGIFVRLWLRNVGNGLAIIPPDGCTITGPTTDGTSGDRIGHVDQPVLPALDEVTIEYVIEGAGVTLEKYFNRDGRFGDFRLSVTYTDANGKQPVRATIHVAASNPHLDAEWLLNRIDYVALDDETALATVRFDAAVRSTA